MPSEIYNLVNPLIHESLETKCSASSPEKAAKKIWSNISEHMVSHVPRFIFTLKGGNIYHHFEVTEDSSNNKFTITELDSSIDSNLFEEFNSRVANLNKSLHNKKSDQLGGTKVHRKRYDDSSSSSSDSDFLPFVRSSPIVSFHYLPRVYYGVYNVPTIVDFPNTTLNPVIAPYPIFTPIFRSPLNPFVGIW